MKNIWSYISYLGISKEQNNHAQSDKRLIFFNQVLFFGIFATLSQIITVWPFIGSDSLVFLVVCAALGFSLYLNARNQSHISKWIYVIVVYSMGLLTTLLLGGSSLYHIQSVLIFQSCLVLFDFRKEKFQILMGIPFVFLTIYEGEYGLFGAPDFSGHYWNETARLMNLSSLFIIGTVLTSFIIRLNRKYETELSDALSQLMIKSDELGKSKSELEHIVEQRTQKLVEQRNTLQSQNEEKVVLLQEIHHRVRNNLQIIISLINLQMIHLKNDEAVETLKEIQSRVHSMSLVHQRMYQTSDFKNIGLQDYATHIIDNLSNLYGEHNFKVNMNIPEDVHLEMDQAIPVGLMMNEIIANFFKHAASSDGDARCFDLSVHKNTENYELIYHDNGDGFIMNNSSDTIDSLGIQLIANLAEQMDGDFSYYNEDGAVYKIHFPVSCQPKSVMNQQ